MFIKAGQDGYFGEIPEEDIQEVIVYAREHSWGAPLNDFPRDKHPRLVSLFLLNYARADWRILFPIKKDSKALDLGRGQLCFLMSEVTGHVVAFEKGKDRLEIVRLRKEGEKVDNIQIVEG